MIDLNNGEEPFQNDPQDINNINITKPYNGELNKIKIETFQNNPQEINNNKPDSYKIEPNKQKMFKIIYYIIMFFLLLIEILIEFNAYSIIHYSRYYEHFEETVIGLNSISILILFFTFCDII